MISSLRGGEREGEEGRGEEEGGSSSDSKESSWTKLYSIHKK